MNNKTSQYYVLYKGIVRITRIFADHKRSLRENNRIYRQNIDSTSTSKPEQWTDRISKEYGFKFRIVQWKQDKIWILVEENKIVSQE